MACKLRVFFIPFYATGHMIPLVDLAFLFATRPNVDPTIVTTPANAALLQPTIDHYNDTSGNCHVSLLLYPFPASESNVLPNQENIASISYADIYKICTAGDLSKPAVSHLLRLHRPDAIISDATFWWMPSLARELNIPNLAFHAIGVFPQVFMDSLHQMETYHKVENPSNVAEIIDVPVLGIGIPRAELPLFLRKYTQLTETWSKIKSAQKESFGVVVNTFNGLEKDNYNIEEYRSKFCKKAWFVGPLMLAATMAGGKRVVEEEISEQCLKWLDGKLEKSVVFVCFGSWCNFTNEQLKQMALGLEESGKNFLWAVRGIRDGKVIEEKDWMPDGWWEKRVEGRGLVVRGWCPQVMILGHKAVGGFMMHCGWNSVMEVTSAGVAALTWPLVFEQFMSERLMVEGLGVGERVWDGFRSTADEDKVVVPKEAIGNAVARFVEEGGDEARERARKLAAVAREAVMEGGESWKDLNYLIDDLEREKEKNKKNKRIELGSETLRNGGSAF